MSNWDYATEQEREEGREAYDPSDPKHPDFSAVAENQAEALAVELHQERKHRHRKRPFVCSEGDVDESGGLA